MMSKAQRHNGLAEPSRLEGEEWRAVTGCPGYEVSNFGRVRAIHIVAQEVLYKGYKRVCLYGREKRAVHRLVCQEFHGHAPDDKPQVAHLDGDASNNRADNLTWVSQSENEAHKRIHGTATAKLCEADVVDIRRRVKSGQRRDDVADSYGVDISTIHQIHNRITWKWLEPDAQKAAE